jgi:hypothetical protein
MNKFRFENGSMYVYDADQKAYIFVSKLLGRSKAQAVRDYEEYVLLFDTGFDDGKGFSTDDPNLAAIYTYDQAESISRNTGTILTLDQAKELCDE